MTKFTLLTVEQARQVEQEQRDNAQFMVELVLDWALRLGFLAAVLLNTI